MYLCKCQYYFNYLINMVFSCFSEVSEIMREVTAFQKKLIPVRLRRDGLVMRFVPISHAIAGSAGYCLPHVLADLMEVVVDRKDLAAPRAAKRDNASADPEFHCFIAFFAFHIWHSGKARSMVFLYPVPCTLYPALLLHLIQLDRQLPELGRGDLRRRLGHDTDRLLRLGEGDHVTD